MTTDFVLDGLEQALYAKRPDADDALIHHSDRGVQYVSIRYTERLAEAGIEPFVENNGIVTITIWLKRSMVYTKQSLYKKNSSWQTKAVVKLATLEWVHWFNYQRLIEPISYTSPADTELNY